MKEIALYIHIPFCKQKCQYCDFPSCAGEEHLMEEYAKALSMELDTIKEKVKSIFIGGGTPTYLSLQGWQILQKSIDKLQKTADLEFTVEANPGTFTKEKLALLKQIGVNRLSIGLQAWQNSLLEALGRIHSIEEFKESYHMAKSMGFHNINIDLMFGLPNQTMEQWKETLEKVVALQPEHLSCYSLIVEEDTPFYVKQEKGILTLPGEEEERAMYHLAVEYLKEKGFIQYEISNFCKPNKDCKHNLVYWDLEDYLGCGAAAHGYYHGTRYRNEKNVEKYISKIQEEKKAIIESHKNTMEENMEEFMFLGLRKRKGICKETFHKRFGVSLHQVYGEVLKKYTKTQWLVETEERVFLSKKGVEVSNSIMAEFLLSGETSS